MQRLLTALLCSLPLFALPSSTLRAAETATNRGKYAVVKLTTDTSQLSADEQEMVKLLIQAARQMDAIFWKQAYGQLGEVPSTRA